MYSSHLQILILKLYNIGVRMHTAHVLYSSSSSDPPKSCGDCWSFLCTYMYLSEASAHLDLYIY